MSETMFHRRVCIMHLDSDGISSLEDIFKRLGYSSTDYRINYFNSHGVGLIISKSELWKDMLIVRKMFYVRDMSGGWMKEKISRDNDHSSDFFNIWESGQMLEMDRVTHTCLEVIPSSWASVEPVEVGDNSIIALNIGGNGSGVGLKSQNVTVPDGSGGGYVCGGKVTYTYSNGNKLENGDD